MVTSQRLADAHSLIATYPRKPAHSASDYAATSKIIALQAIPDYSESSDNSDNSELKLKFCLGSELQLCLHRLINLSY